MSASRASAKSRALTQLQRMREISKDVFRILDLTARTGKEEGGAERAEALANNRERLLTQLYQAQSELNESVEELKRNNAHKERMDMLYKETERREAALREYGAGLQKVENILSEGLRNKTNGGSGAQANQVEVDVDELVLYAHLLSYTSGAKEGWEANTPLVGALPPAPHVGLFAQSRLFPARRPRMPAHKEEKVVPEHGEASTAGGKRPAPEPFVRTWNRPQDGESSRSHSHDHAEIQQNGEASSAEMNGAEPPSKRQYTIQHLQTDNTSKSSNSAGPTNGEHDAHFVRMPLSIPQKPAKWRPGDAIVIAAER
jgi:hypothetical protein